MHGAEQHRHAIARRRYWWKKYQNRIDISRLVFIDETWTKTNMAPLRGWGVKGLRLQAYVPQVHWKTMTFVAALRCDGITAPCVFNGPINGESFLNYVEQFLVPVLRQGDVVIMDNLGSHKGQAVRDAIRAVRAAQPFSNPPPGLVDPETGFIDFGFAFIFEIGQSPKIHRYRR